MSNLETVEAPREHPSPPHGRLLAAAMIMGVGIVVAYGLQLQSRERAGLRGSLQTINGLLALPEDASRERVYAELSGYLEEHDEARRARIARQLGIEPDWTRILERIDHLSSARRTEIYRAIAEEYALPRSLTQSDIQRRFLSSKGMPRGSAKMWIMRAMPQSRM